MNTQYRLREIYEQVGNKAFSTFIKGYDATAERQHQAQCYRNVFPMDKYECTHDDFFKDLSDFLTNNIPSVVYGHPKTYSQYEKFLQYAETRLVEHFAKKLKPKKKTISKTLKRAVWNTNIGEDIGKSKCLCCKMTDITQLTFECGHVIAEANGGETNVQNLRPICSSCNKSMGTQNMGDFMKVL